MKTTYLTKDLYLKYRKNSKFNNYKKKNPIRNWAKTRIDISLKDILIGNKYINRCSPLAIREMQIKTTMIIITHLPEYLEYKE